jgi:hypothetical protein
VNCHQTRALLAMYRDCDDIQTNTPEFVDHLESCSACKQAHDEYNLVGERLRSLPTIKPAPDARSRLMQALVTEHTRFLQEHPTAIHVPAIPDFLSPYFKEHTQRNKQADMLTAFSTADTGPLPILAARAKRRRPVMNQFAIIGLAATFLLVLMGGGLTSLVLLAKNGQAPVTTISKGNNNSVHQLSPLVQQNYPTTTSYSHVASAVGDQSSIYYTAYGDNNDGWMLEKLDTATKVSTPLLTAASQSALIVLASSSDWLIWLQLDPAKTTTGKNTHLQNEHLQSRPWSLHMLYLGNDPATAAKFSSPITLAKDTFDEGTAPSWTHSPVAGVWFVQNSLLVTTLDAKGNAHLIQYQMNTSKGLITKELATASNGHILTSPTATSDGTNIYWSEEWLDNGSLHSNIWLQHIGDAPRTSGKWIAHQEVTKDLFLEDGASFRPQVVKDTLFVLRTNNSIPATPTPGATSTPTVSTTPTVASTTPTATSTPEPSISITSRTDPAFYASAPDDTIQGKLLTFSAINGDAQDSQLDNTTLGSAPQAGGRFLLWQTNKELKMYDVDTDQQVVVGTAINTSNAQFLAINGNTAIWITTPDSATSSPTDTTTSTDPASIKVTFNAFTWPSPTPKK